MKRRGWPGTGGCGSGVRQCGHDCCGREQSVGEGQ